MSKLHVKTGDTVVLLTGDYKDKFEDKGKRKTGKVLEVSPKENKVIVEGINMITKQNGTVRQPHQSRGSYLRFKGSACVSKMRQADKSRSRL